MVVGVDTSIKERIKQLRSQMLIHSYLYYWKDSPIISDDDWQRRANELRDLQKEYNTGIGWYDKEFEDWAGDTGCHLPRDEWVVSKSLYIYRLHNTLGV